MFKLALPLLVVIFALPSYAQESEVGDGAELERARQLYLEADFASAQETFQAILGSPNLEPATVVEARRYLAALALIVGDQEGAQGYAREAVAVDRDVHAPEGAPPELEGLFDLARAEITEPQPQPEPDPDPVEIVDENDEGDVPDDDSDHFTLKWVTLAFKLGLYVPTIVNDMQPHFTTSLEVGLLLPFHERRLSVVLGGGYSPPGKEGEGADPRIGDSGGSWTYDMTTHEVFLSLGIVYRFLTPGRTFVPYAGVFGCLYLLHTSVTGSGEALELGDNREQSTHGGFLALFGGEVRLGPGAFLFEAAFGWSKLPHEITGETSTGALAVNVGYRLFL